MATYSARAFTAATAGLTNFEAVFALWNPSTTRRIELLEAGVYKAGTTSQDPLMCRTSDRGVAGSTVTPDDSNAWDGNDPPPSGALLDLAAFTVQPTKATNRLVAASWGSGTGSGGTGFVWTFPRGLWIPPGRGVAWLNRASQVVPASECYVVWRED